MLSESWAATRRQARAEQQKAPHLRGLLVVRAAGSNQRPLACEAPEHDHAGALILGGHGGCGRPDGPGPARIAPLCARSGHSLSGSERSVLARTPSEALSGMMSTAGTARSLMSPVEVARLLHVDASTVRRMVGGSAA